MGFPSLKTHVKCVLVVRRERGGVRHYVHIGTGNYNPKTARIYADLGLFTADPEIGADIAEMFNSLTGYARPRRYREVLVAPFNLFKGIHEEIERTIASHSPSKPARIRMKMNSLLDAPMIQALYRASQAGCRCRSTCAASARCARACRASRTTSRWSRSSAASSSTRGSTRSSAPASRRRVYIGSADLMPRNLYNRVELVTPIRDPKVRAELVDVLDRSLRRQHELLGARPVRNWNRRRPDGEPRNVQRELIERHLAKSASGAKPE